MMPEFSLALWCIPEQDELAYSFPLVDRVVGLTKDSSFFQMDKSPRMILAFCYLYEVLIRSSMPFIDYNTIPHRKLMNGIHGALYHSDQLTFGHLVLEEGALLPEHHHVHEQWTHVIEGDLEFTLAGETQVMTPGVSVFIPSNTVHSAKALTKCKVIDAFLPVREDFKTLELWSRDPHAT